MKILITVVFCIVNFTLLAQSVAINNDGSLAAPSAILDAKSTTKGMLIPRMTTVERTGISSPVNGLLVYDTDSVAFSYFNGATWAFLKSGIDTSVAWGTKGNVGTTSTNFIGTTDANDLYFKIYNTSAGYIKNTSNNTAFGYRSGVTVTGTNNTIYGSFAGNFPMSGSFNTAIGVQTLNNTNTGSSNTGVGYYNLRSGVSGSFNTALGTTNIQYTTGNYNIGIGTGTLTKGFETGQNFAKNIAIGRSALAREFQGIGNIAIGEFALFEDTIGYSNIAIGNSALFSNTSNKNLIAIGDSALYYNKAATNLAIGSKSLFNNISGTNLISIGTNAATKLTQGFDNIIIGNDAMAKSTKAFHNIAIGNNALNRNENLTSGYGYDNVAIGVNTLQYDTIGINNTAIGSNAAKGSFYSGTLTGNFSHDNTSIGAYNAYNTKRGYNNTSIGSYSLYADTSGIDNATVGHQAMYSARNINRSVAIGSNALYSAVNGANNTFIGYATASIFVNANNETAIGANAYVTADNSMVLGSINGTNGATADTKVGIGVTAPSEKLEIGNGRLRFKGNLAGGNAHGITWTNNAGTTDRAFIGMETDDYWGVFNFGLGSWNVRVHNTTGEVGIFKQPANTSGFSRLQVKQSSANADRGIGIETAINTNRWDMWVDNNAAPDYNFNYNGALRGYFQNATGNYIVVSDKNYKKNITDLPLSLSSINQLKTYHYHYSDNSAADPLSIGFMAQDVQKIFPHAVSEKIMENGQKRLGINYQYFTVMAIKGLQEQQQIIETQNKKIEDLQSQIDEIKKKLK